LPGWLIRLVVRYNSAEQIEGYDYVPREGFENAIPKGPQRAFFP